ncbi:MAG: DUF350 domain-containing protein [Thermoleophilaceae bacterium]|jgi:uncharacterized membrane protein YjfL (UPF0719 family)
MTRDYLIDLAGGLLYGAEGIALMAVGYVVIDLLTPGNLGRIMVEERNRDAGIIVGAALIGIGTIVTVAIYSAAGNLGQGLLQAGGYGLVGILLMGVAFRVIDLLTPDRLGHIVMSNEDHPVTYMISASLVAVGAILAAAISP